MFILTIISNGQIVVLLEYSQLFEILSSKESIKTLHNN